MFAQTISNNQSIPSQRYDMVWRSGMKPMLFDMNLSYVLCCVCMNGYGRLQFQTILCSCVMNCHSQFDQTELMTCYASGHGLGL